MEFVVASLILLGFGLALFSSPNTNAVMGSVERRFYGSSLGNARNNAADWTDAQHGHCNVDIFHIRESSNWASILSTFLTSIKTAFIIFAVLCFVGIFASLARGKVQ